jgi:hypothetical protein
MNYGKIIQEQEIDIANLTKQINQKELFSEFCINKSGISFWVDRGKLMHEEVETLKTRLQGMKHYLVKMREWKAKADAMAKNRQLEFDFA